jgi:hypothetical protein
MSQLRRLRKLPGKVRAAPARIPQVAKAIVAEPIETLLYVPEQLDWWRHAPVAYDVADEWGPWLHENLGCDWPCPELDASRAIWGRVSSELAAQGLNVGRMTYGVYSDSDPALAAAIWCAVRHLDPTRVIETGVARGVTTRMILEAMTVNDRGRLWSIDLPYLFDSDLQGQTGVAVTEQVRDRWTYVRGSSRRRLRPVVAQVGATDIFVHDSLHTVRNMRFEMETVWPILREGGVMFIDDVDRAAFRDFTNVTPHQHSRVFRSGDGPWMFGVIVKSK